MLKLRLDQYLTLFLCSILLLLQGSVELPLESALVNQVEAEQLTLVQPAPVPVVQDSTSDFTASLSAQAIVALDYESGSTLLAKNPKTPLYPASTTKLMTALVALDHYRLDQVLTVPVGLERVGHTVGLRVGEQFTVKSLLAAILVNSGNDAAQLLAQGLSNTSFVDLMNNKAQQLHLADTRFANASGFDHSQQQMTAADLALLAKEALKQSMISELVNTQQMQITDVTGQSAYELFNTNQLLYQESGIHGVKTGTTPLAGQVLITLWNQKQEQHKHPVLIVVMNSQDRYHDTRLIINWLKSQVAWRDLAWFTDQDYKKD
jgi:D-alanyl-D-alanine carboxypeptidase (penicillin-binding protein 5/6)